MQDKRFGYFDDDNREYVITDPKTPWPWINYLGNEDFFSLISNTAGGYSFYKDAKFRRIPLPLQQRADGQRGTKKSRLASMPSLAPVMRV